MHDKTVTSRAVSWLLLFLIVGAEPTFACTPGPDWKEPTPESSFRAASVVIHARVVSTSPDGSVGNIQLIREYKGRFSGDTVVTGPSSGCGIDRFDAGREYVFFFGFFGPNSRFVSHLVQPALSTKETLDALRKLRP